MKIINKTTSQWVAFDRSLMRDTRIKSNTKVIYLLFLSLAQSCESVYISYSYIAKEVGYVYNGEYAEGTPEYERAMKKFVSTNLEPLIELGWIKKTNNVGENCDWEVYNHDCNTHFDHVQKSTQGVNKKVHGGCEQKSTLSYKSSKLKEVVEQTPQPFGQNILKKQPEYDSTHLDYLTKEIPELAGHPCLRLIVEFLKQKDDYKEYILYMKINKKDKYLDYRGWRSYFYSDFLNQKFMQSENKSSGNDDEISDEEYVRLMKKHGLAHLI